MGALQYVATSALSLTLSGNTGVGPFITLLIVGVIEKSNPNLLYMDGWIEKIIASWASIAIFGVLSILELVGKCIPCVDAVIDSAMTFVVPILSVFGSLASFGLFTAPSQPQAGTEEVLENDGSGRRLGETSGALIFLQVILCIIGVILALLVHLFKLLIRLMGEGCCTCCITSIEYTWVVGSVVLTIFIIPIAIGTAILLLVAAGIGFKRKVWDKRKKRQADTAGEEGQGNQQRETNDVDEEQPNQEVKQKSESSQPDNIKSASEQKQRMDNEEHTGEETTKVETQTGNMESNKEDGEASTFNNEDRVPTEEP